MPCPLNRAGAPDPHTRSLASFRPRDGGAPEDAGPSDFDLDRLAQLEALQRFDLDNPEDDPLRFLDAVRLRP